MLTVPTRNPIRSVTRSPLGVPGWVARASSTRALWDANWAAGRFYYDGMEYANHDEFLTAIGGTFARTSEATYFDSNGILQTAASGALRFDHDPATKAPLGILLEGARENLCLQSEDFGTTWVELRTTVTTNQAVSPDGNTTADLITESSDDNTHRVYQSLTPDGSSRYCFSCFIKANARTEVRLDMPTAGFPGSIYADFNLSDGTVLATGGGEDDSGIIDVGNGWYRCWVVGTSDAAAATLFSIYPLLSGAVSYQGTGANSIYGWGAQLEIGRFPSSYIKTTTTAVTSAADSYTIGSSLLNATEGALVIDIDISAFNDFAGIVGFDGTGSKRFGSGAPNRWNIYAGLNVDGPAGTMLGWQKAGVAWSNTGDNTVVARNGVLGTDGDAGTISFGAEVQLGAFAGGGSPWGGPIRIARLTWFNVDIGADLSVLTT